MIYSLYDLMLVMIPVPSCGHYVCADPSFLRVWYMLCGNRSAGQFVAFSQSVVSIPVNKSQKVYTILTRGVLTLAWYLYIYVPAF